MQGSVGGKNRQETKPSFMVHVCLALYFGTWVWFGHAVLDGFKNKGGVCALVQRSVIFEYESEWVAKWLMLSKGDIT